MIARNITDLEGLRLSVARGLVVLTLVQVPCLGVIAAWLGGDVATAMVAAAALAAAPALLLHLERPTTTVAFALTVALVGQTSLLVYLFKGHPWQIEMHFYYFAVLAMLSGFCGWGVILLAAGLILAQHLVLNFVMPAALYGGGGDIKRVLVHGWIVVVESGMLILIGGVIRKAFARLDDTRVDAERAAADLANAADAREAALEDANARTAELRALLQSFEADMTASVDSLGVHAAGLKSSGDRLGASSAKTTGHVVTVSVAAEEMSRTVDMMAASGQQLSLTIGEVGASVAKSAELAAAAVEQAHRASATMDEMAAVSAEIGHVTGLISGIAAQTNLLALNATIEAARAGEAGRGFSVVAQEVKALATQTSKATHDIAERVAAIQGTSGRSMEAIRAVSAKIRELEQVAAIIASAVVQQVHATDSIANNAKTAASGAQHTGAAIAQIERFNNAHAEEVLQVGAGVDGMAKHIRDIHRRVRLFTDAIERLRA